MKKLIYIGIPLLAAVMVAAGCGSEENKGNKDSKDAVLLDIEEGEPAMAVGDGLPVSRGLAAKMTAMAFNEKNAILSMDREITFLDTDGSHWYDKYINAVVSQGYFSGYGEGNFLPEEALTLGQAQSLLDSIDPNNNIKIRLDDENRDKAISYALWCQLYKQCLENAAGDNTIEAVFGICETSFVVLASQGNNPILPEGYIITDEGPYSIEGISGDAYIDMAIGVLEKNGEIIAILQVMSQEPVIRNAYVVQARGNSITIFSGGAEREYAVSGAESVQEGAVIDLKVSQGTCITFDIKEEVLRGKVLKAGDTSVEIYGFGEIPLSQDFKVYSIEDGPVKWKGIRNLIVGRDLAYFAVKEGVLQAAVIDTTPSPETIRVVLGDTGFNSLTHGQVVLSATGGFTIVDGNGVRDYSQGEDAVFSNPSDINGRAFVQAVDGGRIMIKSIERNGEQPSYRGTIEIIASGSGFTVVNEVRLEEYLYSVVPSEMPASYGIEALKIQAVTARSYAYNQFYGNKYCQYGANVDDSVLSQVYNNVSETDIAIRAVDETAGQCLTYEGAVISANFFSTSSGMTANSGEVWADADTKAFPAATSAYLRSKKQYSGTDYGDLSVEENAAAFFKDWDIVGYDSNISWFRWRFEMTAEEIAAAINGNLSERYQADPALIKTLQPDGLFRSKPVDTIGAFVNIEALQRGEGGNLMALRITGTENTIVVYTEYNIRTLLRPQTYIDGGRDIVIERRDGTQISNYSLIPSGFFAMERMTDGDGNILYVRFNGGGNGHGVGMSQNGAKGMIDAGYSFEEVLAHYYGGTAIIQMY